MSFEFQTQNGNVRFVTNLCLQKFHASEFKATTHSRFHPDGERDSAGLVIMGQTRVYLAFYNRGDEIGLFRVNLSIKPGTGYRD